MSELADEVIARFIEKRPLADRLYVNDSEFHARTEELRRLLHLLEEAMEYEALPYDVARRIMARTVFGALPEDYQQERYVSSNPVFSNMLQKVWGAEIEHSLSRSLAPYSPDSVSPTFLPEPKIVED